MSSVPGAQGRSGQQIVALHGAGGRFLINGRHAVVDGQGVAGVGVHHTVD